MLSRIVVSLGFFVSYMCRIHMLEIHYRNFLPQILSGLRRHTRIFCVGPIPNNTHNLHLLEYGLKTLLF